MVLVVMAAASPMSAQAQAPDVIGCDSLVALRLLTAGARSSTDAGERLSAHPGCRRISRAELGDVSQRAMIGGVPFECLTIRGSDACLWVAP
ncbi:hypothetical protein [uncultured Methylobacterium sp.]|uniref:hypothetical protein n=1 Tax=uncultured Methylobacterium sp. TaxID=157278 RepID=UPI0035CC9235